MARSLNDSQLGSLKPTNTEFAQDANKKASSGEPVATYDAATRGRYATEADIQAALLSEGYSARQLATMTYNDKHYALRLADGLVD